MTSHGGHRRLAAVVGRRIVLFTLLAMAAQLLLTVWRYAEEPDNLASLLLDRETEALAAGIKRNGDRYVFELPPGLAPRYAATDTGYVARVRDPTGRILFANCGAACPDLPEFDPDHSFWLNRRSASFPLSFQGGQVLRAPLQGAVVEVAVDRDPQNAVWRVFADEIVEAMLVPMGLTLLLALGATLLSIRTALAPVQAAAEAAERLDPLQPETSIPAEGMPLEVAQLAGAVDRSFARVRDLVSAQRLFTSAIAHEIRTPLSIIRLELERIDHPRARRAMAELDDLARFVSQLTALARLEAADRSGFTTIALDDLACEVAASLAPWIYERGAAIAVEAGSGMAIGGNAPLLRDAVRNLIENAARHGGRKVSIVVRTGPGARIEIADDGPGLDRIDAEPSLLRYEKSGGMGIGLEIVRRIASLHEAAFSIAAQPGGGARAEILFAQADATLDRKSVTDHAKIA